MIDVEGGDQPMSVERATGRRTDASPELLAPSVVAGWDLEGHLAQEYADALAEVPRLPGETGVEARMREVCYLYLTRFLPNLLDRKDRMSMAVGLEARVPFCDHRLVEYVFNAPWAMKTFDGREKSLLRAATADLLPRSVAERVKSPYPQTQNPGYVRATSAQLLARAQQPDSVLGELADLDAVRRVAVSPQVADQSLVDRLLSLDAWVGEYGIDVRV